MTTRLPGSGWWLPIVRFKRKVALQFERNEYVVKTAENRWELLQACKLRYDVFHKEYAGKRFPIGLDADTFDDIADHLIIIHRKKKQVVGSYRLISSTHGNRFYSATEFDIARFLDCPGDKLELSRACIRHDSRTGTVMSLLWRGVGMYLAEVGARYFFGLSSIKSTDPAVIADAAGQIKTLGRHRDDGFVTPHDEYRMTLPRETVATELPGLFKAYLKLGAEIHGEPAFDRDFHCADFFTVVDRQTMCPQHERKFVRRGA